MFLPSLRGEEEAGGRDLRTTPGGAQHSGGWSYLHLSSQSRWTTPGQVRGLLTAVYTDRVQGKEQMDF